MFDSSVRAFIERHSGLPPAHPPASFEVTVYNAAHFEGRGGIQVLQSQLPMRKARLNVDQPTECRTIIRTENIRRLRFLSTGRRPCLGTESENTCCFLWVPLILFYFSPIP